MTIPAPAAHNAGRTRPRLRGGMVVPVVVSVIKRSNKLIFLVSFCHQAASSRRKGRNLPLCSTPRILRRFRRRRYPCGALEGPDRSPCKAKLRCHRDRRRCGRHDVRRNGRPARTQGAAGRPRGEAGREDPHLRRRSLQLHQPPRRRRQLPLPQSALRALRPCRVTRRRILSSLYSTTASISTKGIGANCSATIPPSRSSTCCRPNAATVASTRAMPATVLEVSRTDADSERFIVNTSIGRFTAHSLVVATGGLSIPKIGASPLGYRLAEQFGLAVVAPRPALVPLTLPPETLSRLAPLAGISLEVEAHCAGPCSARRRWSPIAACRAVDPAGLELLAGPGLRGRGLGASHARPAAGCRCRNLAAGARRRTHPARQPAVRAPAAPLRPRVVRTARLDPPR